MPDAAGAAALKSLVDRPGTGNITELSKEQRRYRSVRFTGQHYASLQDEMVAGVAAYAEDVRTGRYPGPEHGYSIEEPELEAFREALAAR